MTGHTLTVTVEHLDAGWTETWTQEGPSSAADAKASRLRRLRDIGHRPTMLPDGLTWEPANQTLGRDRTTLTWHDLPDQALPAQTCTSCGVEHPGELCAAYDSDLFGGAA